MPADQRRAAQRATLATAAALGIGSVHEMAGPEVSSAEDLADPRQNSPCQIGQVLVWPHQIEVPVRLQLKQLENLGQHLAVLPGDADLAVETRPARQSLEDRRKLDGFGSGPENEQ